jgi:hypothetical protein
MSAAKQLIEGLDQAIELEHRVMQHYKRAGDEAADKGVARRLYAIEENHHRHIERLEARREGLKEHHFWSDAMKSIGDAVSGIVAGLPRDFIESETFPTYDTLVRSEEQLIAAYEHLRALADQETAELLDAAIADSRLNISTLMELDTLR